jgi:hypothetical protein
MYSISTWRWRLLLQAQNSTGIFIPVPSLAYYGGHRLLPGKRQARQIVHKGDGIKCTPGVAHWHRAAPDSTLAYIAVSPAQKGETKWLQRVTDEEYHSADSRQSRKENDKQ